MPLATSPHPCHSHGLEDLAQEYCLDMLGILEDRQAAWLNLYSINSSGQILQNLALARDIPSVCSTEANPHCCLGSQTLTHQA